MLFLLFSIHCDCCQGHRLNSPNDLAFSKRGDLYFTDPPYGLPLRQEDPEFQAHGFGGVYLVTKEAIEAARAAEVAVGGAPPSAATPEPVLVERGVCVFRMKLSFPWRTYSYLKSERAGSVRPRGVSVLSQ